MWNHAQNWQNRTLYLLFLTCFRTVGRGSVLENFVFGTAAFDTCFFLTLFIFDSTFAIVLTHSTQCYCIPRLLLFWSTSSVRSFRACCWCNCWCGNEFQLYRGSRSLFHFSENTIKSFFLSHKLPEGPLKSEFFWDMTAQIPGKK